MKFIRDFAKKYECGVHRLTKRGYKISPVVPNGLSILYKEKIALHKDYALARGVCPIGFTLEDMTMTNKYFWTTVIELYQDTYFEDHFYFFCESYRSDHRRVKCNNKEQKFALNLGHYFYMKYFRRNQIVDGRVPSIINQDALREFGVEPNMSLNYELIR